MSYVEIIAFILSAWVLVEFVIWLVKPGWLIAFSKAVYSRTLLTQVVLILIGAGLLYLLLQQFTIVDVMAVTFLGALLSGLAVVPFGPQLLETLQGQIENKRFVKEFALVWSVWIILAIWTLYELFA